MTGIYNTKTELYRTNTKGQGLVPAYFALIISIVVHVYSKTSININKYMQKAVEPENDAGFPKHNKVGGASKESQ